MPAVYDKMGIRFLYPENWTLDEEGAMGGDRSVTVYSPGGAFWSIALHPPSVEPVDLADSALEALKSEYSALESESASETIGRRNLRGFDISFFYLDFSNSAVIRAFRTVGATCLVLCQAEDREFDRIAPVFQAMTTSLISEDSGERES